MANLLKFFGGVGIILLLSGIGQAQLWSGVLAPARATDWSGAGTRISDASWTQQGSTLSACGTSGSHVSPATCGITAAMSAANTAAASSGVGKKVVLGSGNFYLTTGMCFTGFKNVELVGQGPGVTNIFVTTPVSCQDGEGTGLVGYQSSDSTFPGGVGTAVVPVNTISQNANTVVVPGGVSSLSITPNVTMLIIDWCDTGYSGATTGSGTATCATGTGADNGNAFNCGTINNGTGATGCSSNGPDSGSARFRRFGSEIVQAVSCSPSCSSGSSTTITISPGFVHANIGSNPEIFVVQPTVGVGFKDFSITDQSANSTAFGIGFNNSEDTWAQRVQVNNAGVIGVWVTLGAHHSFLDSYLYNVGQAGTCSGGVPGNGACDPWGWKDGLGEDNLVQNNIIQASRVCIANGEGPAVADVTAYNYCVNQYDGSDFVWGAFWQHANGDDYDLREGNVGDQVQQDTIHGSHLFNSDLRNLYTGWDSCANNQCNGSGGTFTAKSAGTSAIDALAYTRYSNLLGNLLGTAGVTTNYASTTCCYFGNTLASYIVGSGDPGGDANVPQDNLVGSTMMRWGDYDIANNAILFCTAASTPIAACSANLRGNGATTYPALAITSTTLPASFYLSGKPAWFGSIPFPPMGPDVTGGNLGIVGGTINTSGHQSGMPAIVGATYVGNTVVTSWGGHGNVIPAMACYLNAGGLPDGTGSAITFTPSTCYASVSSASPPSCSPGSGNYPTSQSVVCTNPNSGTTVMCYTTNGTSPATNGAGTSCSTGTAYTTTLAVTVPETLTVIAGTSTLTDSSTVAYVYTFTIATPTFNPPAGTYPISVSPAITAQSGATICYTLDGSTPLAATPGTCSHGSTISSGTAVTITSSGTVKAIGTASGLVNSAVGSAAYVLLPPPSNGTPAIILGDLILQGGK